MIPLKQALTTTTNAEITYTGLPQSLTPSEELSLERFRNSRLTPLVKETSMGLFIDELLKGMNMLGLKGERLPSEGEMVNMYKSVLDEYPNLKIGELSLAFNLAATGKLDVEVETYQNFSMLYLHRILRSFARYGLQKLSEIKPVQKENKWLPREVTEDEKIDLAFECYKKFRQWDGIVFGLEAFYILYKRKELRFNAAEIYEMTIQEMTKKMMSLPYLEKIEMRGKMQDEDFMENQCRRMALSIYFESKLK